MISTLSRRSPAIARIAFASAAALLLGCGGSTTEAATKGAPVATGDKADAGGETSEADSATVVSSPDAAAPPGDGDDAGQPAEDAAARNSACTPLTAQTGTLVNTDHGRLDGTLVYVLPQDGSARCNGDDSHVHLQIEVSGLIYDVAVDIGSTGDDVGMYEETIAVPGGAWAEGWHSADSLAYPSLGLTVAQFPIVTPEAIASNVESLLVGTSKISIFCTGYTTDNGCHDVHYENGKGNDGAIVLDPTAATSPILFFRFEGQTSF